MNEILEDLNSNIFSDYLNDLKLWDYRIQPNQNTNDGDNKINQKSLIYPKFYELKENEIDDKRLITSSRFGIGSFICNYYQELPIKRIYEIKLGLLRYCLKNKIILKRNEDIKELLDKFSDEYFINVYKEYKESNK